MKVIAYYLPQFHRTPENDLWWGEGFTEWTNVKKALPFFEGHNQPRVPLDGNYYNLLDDEVKIWQADLAKKYGIYGFSYYHYWFNGKLLLEKPMEQMLSNRNIDIPFCICWANEDWTKAWVDKEKTVLISQEYGARKEWIEHFNYLLPFFKDDRYIKENNKPLFIIYRPELIDCLNDMLDCWSDLAVRSGFAGIEYAYQNVAWDYQNNKNDSRFTYDIESQPIYARMEIALKGQSSFKKTLVGVYNFFLKHGIDLKQEKNRVTIRDYDEAWNAIINMKPRSEKSIPGAFVDYDNTSRRQERGNCYKGVSVDKFKHYFNIQLKRARDVYKKDMLFIFAWNEWAESGYLEPDTVNKLGYLEAIRDCLLENGEFPIY